VRICERNNSAETKASEGEGRGGAPTAGEEIPLQPMEKTMVREAVPCSTWRPMVEQVDARRRL